MAALVMAGVALTAAPAVASTFSATELSYDGALLTQFNLVDLGNFSATSNQSIGGRALVGGNVSLGGGTTITACATAGACTGTGTSGGNSKLGVASTPSSVVTATTSGYNNGSTAATYGYGALTVFGNVVNSNSASGAIGFSAPNGGDVNVGGSITARNSTNTNGNINVNNGGVNVAGAVASGSVTLSGSFSEVRATSAANIQSGGTVQTYATAAQVFAPFGTANFVTNNVANPLIDLSRGIAALPGSGVTAQSLPANGSTFVATSQNVNGKSYGLVKTDINTLAAQTNFQGISNGQTNVATFVIVTGNLTGNNALPTLLNNASTGANGGYYNNVIYDFVDATSLAFTGQWNASILAPLATISSEAGALNGTVIVASMTQTQSLNVGNAFTGDLSGLTSVSFRRVPEPASLALIGVGLAAAAVTRRRRK